MMARERRIMGTAKLFDEIVRFDVTRAGLRAATDERPAQVFMRGFCWLSVLRASDPMAWRVFDGLLFQLFEGNHIVASLACFLNEAVQLLSFFLYIGKDDRLNGITRLSNRCSTNNVFQLTNISRPGMIAQGLLNIL